VLVPFGAAPSPIPVWHLASADDCPVAAGTVEVATEESPRKGGVFTTHPESCCGPRTAGLDDCTTSGILSASERMFGLLYEDDAGCGVEADVRNRELSRCYVRCRRDADTAPEARVIDTNVTCAIHVRLSGREANELWVVDRGRRVLGRWMLLARA
jgi:hypothetical protein